MKKFLTCSAALLLYSLGTGAPVIAQGSKVSTPPPIQVQERDYLKSLATTPLPAGVATDASNAMVLSADGRVGFLSTAFGDSVYAFDTLTGQLLSSVRTGTRTARLALFDDGRQRRLAVVNLNDPSHGEFATVSILDASDGRRLSLVSAFILPPDLSFSPFMNPVFNRDGTRVIVASGDPGAIFLLDSATGQMLDRIDLEAGVDSLAIAHQGSRSFVGAVSAAARAVSVFELLPGSTLRRQSLFELPYGLIPTNNLCFNRAGTVGYLASFEGNKLFSFDAATGVVIDTSEVGDGPAQIAWTEFADKPRVAVVNTGLEHGFLADSVSVIEVTDAGRFGVATVFLPPAGTDLTPDSTIVFSRQADIGLVGALTGSVFMFDAESGEQLAEAKLAGQTTRFAISERGNRLLVLGTTSTAERVTVLKVERGIEQSLNSQTPQVVLPSPTAPSTAADKASSVSPALWINRVHLHRIRRGLRLTVDGDGFQPGAQIFVNARSVPTTRRSNTRLIARPSWGFLGRARELAITVQNPDGTTSEQSRKRLRRRH